MDRKASVILEQYKEIIESEKFDEFDILGFLIFVREILDSSHSDIKEFADLIAHRTRTKGRIHDSIKNAIKNRYSFSENGKNIIEYNGIAEEEWVSQWNKLGKKTGIVFSNKIIRDITLCIFSLAQFSSYIDIGEDENGKKYKGEVHVLIGENGSVSIATVDDSPNSLTIGFMKYRGYEIIEPPVGGLIREPIVTIRENKKLRLKCEDKNII